MGLCLRNTRDASSMAGASLKRFLSSVTPPLPFSPPTRKVSSGSPACGTSFISIPRVVPTSTTSLSLPRDNHSRAMASAGKTCPPVAPPAINNFTLVSRVFHADKNSSSHDASFLGCLLTTIKEHDGSEQHDQKARPAVTDERQRNAFGGHHAQHHRKINQGLADDHGRDPQRQESPETVGRVERRPQAAPAVHYEERDHQNRADETQFFANYGVNKIGVRFGEIKQFLFALHQAHAAESAGAYRNKRL